MNLPLRLYAHGKLMLSGEYLVMHGALSLGLPLKLGQVMEIVPTQSGIMEWKASDTQGQWFEGNYSLPEMEPVFMSEPVIGLSLQKMLLATKKLNPDFLNNFQGLKVNTRLEFNRSWGLGSSSSLIALLAEFADVDAMELHTNILSGSGYDVACALSETPVLFQRVNHLPTWKPVHFSPDFAASLYFVYLGNKQNSAEEVSLFLKKNPDTMNDAVVEISEIGEKLLTAQNLAEFNLLINRHEQILSEVLEVNTVKSALFADFDGTVKSLGAWGGDFILASSDAGHDYVRDYFSRKGYTTLFQYDNIVLNEPKVSMQNTLSQYD